MLRIRLASPPSFSGRQDPVQGLNDEFDEVAVHRRCYLLFEHRIRSEYAAQCRQQSVGSGKAESAYGLQIRWNGPGHKAMGW